MAWPCISRVCCLARFWNQFDKSDLSVPLTIQNYSEITDHDVRSDPAFRRSWKGRKEPSFKPREDYQPPDVPFRAVTQYKQDFKPWHIPKKDNFPWISNGGKKDGFSVSPSDSPTNQYHQPGPQRAEKEERNRQRWAAEQLNTTSSNSRHIQGEQCSSTGAWLAAPSLSDSAALCVRRWEPLAWQQAQPIALAPAQLITLAPELTPSAPVVTLDVTEPDVSIAEKDHGAIARPLMTREEFRPWMGAKPSKPVRKTPSYVPPSPNAAAETSYRAAFGGDVFKQMETLQVDGNRQQSTLAEKSDPANIRTKGETSVSDHYTYK
ncbi:MAP6 protein, partial [Polyodon spathula]|nr:MAP6 protein [Polyodon spathula]